MFPASEFFAWVRGGECRGGSSPATSANGTATAGLPPLPAPIPLLLLLPPARRDFSGAAAASSSLRVAARRGPGYTPPQPQRQRRRRTSTTWAHPHSPFAVLLQAARGEARVVRAHLLRYVGHTPWPCRPHTLLSLPGGRAVRTAGGGGRRSRPRDTGPSETGRRRPSVTP